MGFMAAFRTAANRIGKSRWMMLVAAFLFMSSVGAFYSFGVYSQFMKTSLNYNQQTLDTIAFFSSLYLGIVPGLINDYLGAWSAILAGSGLNIFGFLMIWLAITKKIPRPQMWQMCFGNRITEGLYWVEWGSAYANLPGNLWK
ncbi:hypothetical protein O6H91_13G098900 [Diphasiastrum complanatum]|uniref:Uncharacterized protein n=1 Tax=Diphasiastrum complanatum TaxID=34168 RepID=A0ACC2BXT5_DIPCM|nr:hypothetical protein O6H91_Y313900 [Diphasiastrum complanatum]KAJ7296457.1 hypothetical protein O6H91_Y121700 [Diphasiastrum complanatum]KAJ7534546.1 hypothetical protein O6H91_13G098900 [Diphasiastrum complanatum]